MLPRVAWRGVAKDKGFAFAAISTLALALALVCVVSAAAVGILHPNLPYQSPDQLVQLGETGVFPVLRDASYHEGPRLTRAVFDDIRGQSVFSSVGEYSFNAVGLQDDDSPTRNVYALSSQVLPMLGVRPALGRWFVPREDLRGQGNVVVLSHAFWVARFGGDSSVVGQRIDLVVGRTSTPHTIVGIMPASFSFPAGYTPDFYLPYGSDAARAVPSPTVIARLAPGTSRGKAEAVLQTVVARHAASDRDAARAELEQFKAATNGEVDAVLPTGAVRASVRTYTHEIEGSGEVRQVALLILIAVVGVLLLAAVNVSNLLLARGHARRVEIGVRRALGASRWAVVRLLLAETGLLTFLGLVPGVVGGAVVSGYLMTGTATGTLHTIVDIRVMALTSAVALGLTVLCSVVPALRMSDFNLNHFLRGGLRAASGVRRLESLSSRLLVVSTAVTMVVIVVTGLLSTGIVKALREMRAGNWKDVAALEVSVIDNLHADEFLRRIARIPGVRGVAYGKPPTSVSLTAAVAELGHGSPLPLGYADVAYVSPDYFSVLEMPLVAGRTFSSADAGGPPPLIVDARTAERLWPGARAVGQRLGLRLNGDSVATEFVVVGVTSSRRLLVNASGGAAPVAFYLPRRASTNPSTWVLLRTTKALSGDVNQQLRRIAQDVGGIRTRTFTTVAALQAQRNSLVRVVGKMFSAFAVTSLLLVVLGLYALTSFVVERRRHELGVRLAVGATGAGVIRLMVGSTLTIAAVGVGIGTLASLGIVPLFRSVLRGLPTGGPSVYVIAGMLILLASALATWFGARRAAHYDPMEILRTQ